jgi:hypothetical protein
MPFHAERNDAVACPELGAEREATDYLRLRKILSAYVSKQLDHLIGVYLRPCY